MPERPDKKCRNEALSRWKADQRAAARARLPISNAELQALFDSLSFELPTAGCDHTLRICQKWLNMNNVTVEPVLEWLHDNGGHCDCEALANAEPAWKDAIYDVDWQ